MNIKCFLFGHKWIDLLIFLLPRKPKLPVRYCNNCSEVQVIFPDGSNEWKKSDIDKKSLIEMMNRSKTNQ